jgi:hypothetical protein
MSEIDLLLKFSRSLPGIDLLTTGAVGTMSRRSGKRVRSIFNLLGKKGDLPPESDIKSSLPDR